MFIKITYIYWIIDNHHICKKTKFKYSTKLHRNYSINEFLNFIFLKIYTLQCVHIAKYQ